MSSPEGVASDDVRLDKEGVETCGVGSFRPRWLQYFANMKVYIAVYSLTLMLHLAYMSYFVGCLRTVEKRFGLSSTKSSFLLNCPDIVQTCVVIAVGYMGRKFHKPKFLGTSVMLCALGIFMSASPYFLYGPYRYDSLTLHPRAAQVAGRPNGPFGAPAEIPSGKPIGVFPESSAEYTLNENGPNSTVRKPSRDPNDSTQPNFGFSKNGTRIAPEEGAPIPIPPRIKGSRVQRGPALKSYQMCDAKESTEPMSRCDGSRTIDIEANYTAFLILILSGIFLGLGNAGLITIGIAFIDENVKVENSAMYIGIASSMHVCGPILGFSLAAFSTRLPEDLGEAKLSPYHPSFIGCWWLGSIVLGSLITIAGLPMFLFPKHFKPYYMYHKARHFGTEETTTILQEIKEFPKSVWKVITNAAFMFLAASKIFSCFYIVGVAVNVSRYIEIHFSQPAFVANVATALCGAVLAGLGSLFGGYIMKKRKVKVQGAANIYVLGCLGTIIGLFVLMMMPCPQAQTAFDGAQQSPLGFELDQQCNVGCSCSRDHYQPVCSPDGVQYFSPCHAGCQAAGENQTLINCSCLGNYSTPVSSGWCRRECNLFIPYMIVLAIVSFLGSMARVPGTVLVFRFVEPELKAFAMGIFSFLLNLLVFVPGPIIFGHAFDASCLLWRTSCGEKRNCLFYDIASFRRSMHGITAVFKLVAFAFAVAMVMVARKRFPGKQTSANQVDKTDTSKALDATAMEDLLDKKCWVDAEMPES